MRQLGEVVAVGSAVKHLQGIEVTGLFSSGFASIVARADRVAPIPMESAMT